MEDRGPAIANIRAALARIASAIKMAIPGARIQNTTLQQDNSMRIIVTLGDVLVKVELSPVIRGSVFSAERMEVVQQVEQKFGYAEMLVASHPDLYAGKLCAALDRQHPRNLFDVKQLYENEGLTNELRKTFLIFLISHFRPMSELLNPNRKDISSIYENEFVQMAEVDVSQESAQTLSPSAAKLMRSVKLPEDSDYKKELGTVLKEKNG